MAYNYVVSSQKPTVVYHSILCNFTAPNELNLILCKVNHLEVFTLKIDGLLNVLDLPLNGRISNIESFRSKELNQDSLLILFQNKKFCILRYDTNACKVVTSTIGSMREKIGKNLELGQMMFIDSEQKNVGMYLYEGQLRINSIENNGLSEGFDVHIDESSVLDIKFISGFSKLTAVMLYEDQRRKRHAKSFSIDFRNKECSAGPWSAVAVDPGARFLITVPSPLNGVVVVGRNTITYIGNTGKHQAIAIQSTQFTAFSPVERDGTRYLLSDQQGVLYLLVLGVQSGKVSGMFMEYLGVTSIAETMTYLVNGVVFIGSSVEDSQLIKLHSERDHHGTNVEILDSYQNIGPVVDMCFMPKEKQLVMCSYAFNNGSLKIVKSGVGFHEQASMDVMGIKGIWSLRQSLSKPFDKYLVQAFVNETRILCIENEQLSEIEIVGFSANERTLFTGNTTGANIIQVTSSGARLIDLINGKVMDHYRVAFPETITTAQGNAEQLVLVVSGGKLILLNIVEEGSNHLKFQPMQIATLEHEIACASFECGLLDKKGSTNDDATSLMEVESSSMILNDDNDQGRSSSAPSSFIAVAMWTDCTVRLLAMPSLAEICQVNLGYDTQARDLLVVRLKSRSYLMVGLGDGQLITYIIEYAAGLPTLTNRRKCVLGSHPLSFNVFQHKGSSKYTKLTDNNICVFAACDRSSIIYEHNGKLSFSILNTDQSEITCMVPFHSELFPGCLAVSSETQLVIGAVEDIQKLHIRSIPLGEAPRRISYSSFNSAFVVCTEKTVTNENGSQTICRVLFLEEGTMEVIGSYELEFFEQGISTLVCTLGSSPVADESEDRMRFDDEEFEPSSVKSGGKEYIVVGTAYVLAEEEEPSRGRIIVFEVTKERKVVVVTERDTSSAVYTLAFVKGFLAAGISSKVKYLKPPVNHFDVVQMYRFSMKSSSTISEKTSSTADMIVNAELIPLKCTHQGHVLVVRIKSQGDLLLVGDLMRSVTLLRFDPNEELLEEVARDINLNYTREIAILDTEPYYMGVDDHENLFVVKRQLNATIDEEKTKLMTTCEYHIGDFVNVLCNGSLIGQPLDTSLWVAKHGTTKDLSFNDHATSESSEMNQSVLNPVYTSVTGMSMANGKNQVLYATVSGSLGNIITLSEDSFRFFSAIEKAMRNFISPVGGLSHVEWRSFTNQLRTTVAKNALDGNLIEMFLDVSDRGELVTIVKSINDELTNLILASVSSHNPQTNEYGKKTAKSNSNLHNHSFDRIELSVEDIYRRVDEISRLH